MSDIDDKVVRDGDFFIPRGGIEYPVPLAHQRFDKEVTIVEKVAPDKVAEAVLEILRDANEQMLYGIKYVSVETESHGDEVRVRVKVAK